MAGNPVALVGSTSSHGGTIISSPTTNKIDGRVVAVVGAEHNCPVAGHGITQVLNGSATLIMSANQVALLNVSRTGCGAIINGNGATNLNST